MWIAGCSKELRAEAREKSASDETIERNKGYELFFAVC
jgi:hypothetical protein